MPESAVKRILRTWRRAFLSAYYRRFKSGRSFTARGVDYRYFYHAYNQTYCNERAVEIPIVWPIVQRVPPERVLEVGNVLSHYFSTRHDVVDNVVTRGEIVTEHVADFEHPLEPGKPWRAIGHLRRCLSPQGRLVMTVPMGYNPHLDRMLESGRIPLDDPLCLCRISRDNRWREASWEEIRHARYGHPYRNANGLVVATFQSA